MQLFAKFKKNPRRGFRATLNFRKFKVALNPLRGFFFYVNVIVLPFRADFKLFEAVRERDRSPCPFANRFVNLFEFQHELFRRDSIRL